MATQTIPKIYLNFETSLATKMASGASSFTLLTSTDDDGTTLSGTYWLVMDEGTTSEEHFIATLSGSAGTVVTNGLSRVDGSTSQSANRFAHDLGASVKITNSPLLLLARLLNGDDTFNAVNWLGVNSISGLATPTAGETTKAANVDYVNAISIAGASDAATNVKGIIEIATSAEAAAGTATGSTGAILAIPASLCSNTSSAAQIIPVTDADGDIPVEFMELDATWTFTGVVDITASNWKLGNTAFTGSMALLNEASTFFNATDINGSEAETLSDGSVADSLHLHKRRTLGINVTSVTVSATTDETTLNSISIPADTLGTTDGVRMRLNLSSVDNSSGNATVTIRAKYGSTTISSLSLTVNSTLSSAKGYIDFDLYANAATNAQVAFVRSFVSENGIEEAGDTIGYSSVTATGTSTEDSTGALNMVVTAQPSSANVTVTMHSAITESL